ncbi:MAG TPA: hypothetical protein VFO60_08985 [Candidatus Dormibacteraeota bacterium]|nr:hypothetical protein [Candidatus Dormibacteraeota bacterium]
MAVDRGFVQRIDVGRGGLVTVLAVLADGTTGTYVISDLDGDPERFNERLAKLAVLRDAMDRAEPVEIEHSAGKAGEEIERAARITRDALGPPLNVDQVAGLVVTLSLHSENALATGGEVHDTTRVRLATTDGGTRQVVLDMQAPERAVAVAQLGMLRDAQASGSLVRLVVAGSSEATPHIVEVAIDDDLSSLGGDRTTTVSGFVESLGLIRLPGESTQEAMLANVRFTTAPDFTGPGNTVATDPFTPQLLTFLVTRGSLTYELFDQGLTDSLRMRVAYLEIGKGRGGDTGGQTPPAPAPGVALEPGAADTTGAAAAAGGSAVFGLALAAELLAPLASASRPVWVRIDREMLDKGPDADCVPGVPSSDLTPMTLRDLHIPYEAEWEGLGCFNAGVYRLQLKLPGRYRVRVDGREVCLYDSTDPGVRFAYACLEGCHTVSVAIEGWTCDNEFDLDVYRLR